MLTVLWDALIGWSLLDNQPHQIFQFLLCWLRFRGTFRVCVHHFTGSLNNDGLPAAFQFQHAMTGSPGPDRLDTIEF